MKYFFNKRIKKIYTEDFLYAFDFDGTLVPIVKDYKHVELKTSIKKVLKKLSKQKTVAIISGRSLKYLRHVFYSCPVILVGNHGIEGIFKKNHLNEYKNICEIWVKKLKPIFKNKIELENKKYTLSIHYNKVKNKYQAKRSIVTTSQKLVPSPRIILGKEVINLVPKGAPNKGHALKQILRKTSKKKAIYVGDDVTDEDVFKLKHPRLITVRVGKHKGSKAQYYLRNQNEIKKLLSMFAN